MSTSQSIIINSNPSETRIALVENNRLIEVHIGRRSKEAVVGNVYKGVVSRVLPGMQSAFVSIGTERSAFLYGGDTLQADSIDPAIEIEDFHEFREKLSQTPIEKILQSGSEILLQIAKDPIGSKGARATMFIAIPGRYLVYTPHFRHIGISRRIEGEEAREELQERVKSFLPKEGGVIVRTAAADAPTASLAADFQYLQAEWKKIQRLNTTEPAPSLLYKEPELQLKIIRDLYTDNVDKILIDNQDMIPELKTFLMTNIPGAEAKIELHSSEVAIFDEYDVEVEIGRALGRKVWLPSGGYLVIDQTEALTVFDVNTGKFVGKLSAQDTILKTNLEATVEIAKQLRLRNIGGIIIIDFIDMEELSHREQILNLLQESVAADKAKTNVLEMSDLGLVQLTRKRTTESIEQQMTEECLSCNGTGRTKSAATLSLDFIRELDRHCLQVKPSKLDVTLRNDVNRWLQKHDQDFFDFIKNKHKVDVTITEICYETAVEPYVVK